MKSDQEEDIKIYSNVISFKASYSCLKCLCK